MIKVKVKLSLLTDHGNPHRYEMSRLPHFLYNQLTDGSEVVNLTFRPPFTPRKMPEKTDYNHMYDILVGKYEKSFLKLHLH
jgi:hypothetical protein